VAFLAGDVENPAQNAAPGELQGNIEIAKLSFRYDGAPRMVLNSISIEAQPGEFIAVTGPSGCGKSTLFKLLLGIEQPTSGAVFYDGRNLNQLDVLAVRSQIGVVMQSASLIPGTIFDYISSGRPLSLSQAWAVARQAGIERSISALPMGMFTIISENGSALSGGEMQRLMIARAIAGNPRILLFDEATSWLDNTAQRKVIESLSRLRITRMVIAHRLSTLQQADRIYVLNQGEVAETGTFTELMEGSGIFSELIKHQLP
jgi:ABC-type bacteriocin/lantibiotic exporter with double-glycine peptidase domain